MSNIGKFHDTTAFLKVAGLTSSTEQISSDHSLRQDIYFKVKYKFNILLKI
jgi:hypothetical protein